MDPVFSWERFLAGVHCGGWGDTFTLLAAAGVLGRVVVPATLSGGMSSELIAPPDGWGVGLPGVGPLCLGLVADRHYFAVVERGRVRGDG